MRLDSFLQLPTWARLLTAALALPAYFFVMATAGGCGGVSSNTPPEPSFYIGHSSDPNPVWYRDGGANTTTAVTLPAALNGVSVRDLFVARYPGNTRVFYLVTPTGLVATESGSGPPIATVPVSGGPSGLALDFAFAYVSSNTANSLAVIDLASYQVVATINLPAGSGPRGLALTPDGKKLYSANNGSNTVSVIDTTTRTVISSINVGAGPVRLQMTSGGDMLFVANSGAGSISVIDTATDTVSSTLTGYTGIQSVGLNAAGDTLVASAGAAVTVLDGDSLTAKSGPHTAASAPSFLLSPGPGSFVSADTAANRLTQLWVDTGTSGTPKTLTPGTAPAVLAMERLADRPLVRASQYSVSTNPTNLTFSVNGTTYTNPQVFSSWTAGSSQTLQAPTPQTGSTPGERFVFLNWTGAVSSTANPLQITVPAGGGAYTANFQRQCRLTITVSGLGTVTAAPTSADGFYPCGSAVLLTATPGTGQQFSAWSGDATGTTSPTTVIMNAERNVTGTFVAGTQIPVSVTTNPANLGVTVGIGTNLAVDSYSGNLPPGSSQTLSASPQSVIQSGSMYRFNSWAPSGPAVTLPLTGTASFVANYLLAGYVVTATGCGVQVGPTNLAVSTNPLVFPAGTQLSLLAAPPTGQTFQNFTITGQNGQTSTLTSNPANFAITQPVTINAVCGTPSSIPVTVNTSPTAIGVTVGIGGGSTLNSHSASLAPSSGQTLTATPSTLVNAGTYYVFNNWTPSGPSVTLPATGSAAYTANYRVAGYTVAASGCGGVAIGPASLAVSTNPVAYAVNAELIANVTVPTGQLLQQIEVRVGTDVRTVTTNPARFVLSGPAVVTATCAAPASTSVSMNSSPITGVTLTVNGASINTPGSANLVNGANHTISAPAQVDRGTTRYAFANWSTGATTPALAINNYTGTPNSFTANYSTAAFQLCLTQQTVFGNPVTIQRIPAGADAGGGCFWYSSGTAVTVSANSTVAAVKSRFSVDGGTPLLAASTIVNVTQPRTVAVSFVLDPAAKTDHSSTLLGSGNTRTLRVTVVNSGTTLLRNVASTFSVNAGFTITGATSVPGMDLNPGVSRTWDITVNKTGPTPSSFTLFITTTGLNLLGGTHNDTTSMTTTF